MSTEQISQEPEQEITASQPEPSVAPKPASYGAGIAISVMAEGRGIVAVACPQGLGSEIYHYETR
jgi:hypothetical protein